MYRPEWGAYLGGPEIVWFAGVSGSFLNWNSGGVVVKLGFWNIYICFICFEGISDFHYILITFLHIFRSIYISVTHHCKVQLCHLYIFIYFYIFIICHRWKLYICKSTYCLYLHYILLLNISIFSVWFKLYYVSFTYYCSIYVFLMNSFILYYIFIICHCWPRISKLSQ